MARKTLWIVLGLVILAVAGFYAWTVFGSGSGPSVTASNGAGFTLVPTDRALGNPKAKVTVIEYAAPSCPVCAHFNEATFPQFKANYIDTGKVHYVFRVFPLREDDGTAEKIARCLPEDKYFAFIDLLFRNQPKWDVEYSQENPSLASAEGVHAGLVLVGRIAGMSAEQVDKCINNPAEDTRINQVAADGQTKYSITGTPTFVINGVAQPAGFFPYSQFSKLLDDAAKQ